MSIRFTFRPTPLPMVCAATLLSCSPTSPTPPPAVGDSLTGTVHESAPTESVAVAGATVQLLGQTAHTATTDASGRYRFTNLTAGGGTLRVNKSGYDPVDTGVTVSGATEQDVALTPTLQTLNSTETGTVSSSTHTCVPTRATRRFYQGSQSLPSMGCGGFQLPVHHDGTLTARLRWSGFSDALGVVLLNRDTGAVLAVASQSLTTTEQITAPVDAGTFYVVGVLYNPRARGTYAFTLDLTRPN